MKKVNKVAPEGLKDCFSAMVTSELYGPCCVLIHVRVIEQSHVTPHTQIKSRITLLTSAHGMAFEPGPGKVADTIH